MSEDLTTPHESDSHASDSPKETEATAAQVEVEVIQPEAVAESEPVKATPPEPAATRVREPIPVAVEESGTKQTFDKVLKIAKDTWVKVQPILKEKGTQFLLIANRFTNNFLDNTGPKLTNQAIAKIPDSTKAKIAEQKAKLQPTLDKLQPLWDKAVVPFWQKVVVPNWNKGIKLLKQRLPVNLQELTERFLTVAVITTFVVIYWFFSSLTSGKPAVAKQPPVSAKPVLTRPTPQRMTQRPMAQPSVAPVPSIKPMAQPSMAPVTTVKPTVVAKPMAPVAEPKVITVPPAAVAKPVVVPTPSIDLADIQAELSSEVADLGEGLVDSVKTANANRQLKVALGSGWDSLSGAEQQEVAQKLWGRSQKLDFKKIELFNGNNTLVARSPVVGTKVIMLQKSTLDSST
jgi:hypothetical protein